jgi:L-ascorbate metabolism protein UlaG (beta-lactamase superfamily)
MTTVRTTSHLKARPLVLIILLAFFIMGSGYWKGPKSDHFNGEQFFNKEPDNTFSGHLKWLWEMKTIPWPDWIDDTRQPKPLPFVKDKNTLRVTYINQATVLIQTNGVNILTDPIFSKRAGPVSWMGSKRIRAPGVKIDDLPKIDVILLSHDHYDHLDIPSLKKILGSSHPPILCGLGVAERLEPLKYDSIKQLDWWQGYRFSEAVKITFVPALHNSGRGLADKDKTLWGGYVIEVPAGNILFAGDTGFGDFFEDIHGRFNGFELLILPIGNYEKRWFMKSQHMNPDDAVRVHEMLNASKSMGIHYATFNEHPEQAVDAHEKDLKTALKKYRVPENDFWILKFGEARELDKAGAGVQNTSGLKP